MVTRPILCATDFSDRAGRAVRRAAQIAQSWAAPLTLIHVVDSYHLQALARLERTGGGGEKRWLQLVRSELAREAEGLHGELGVEVSTAVRVGRIYPEIADAAAECGAGLTVIGAHGEHFLHDLFLGATAHKVVRRSACSTLVVKRAVQGRYRQLLVGVDFSPGSGFAIEAARRLAPKAGTEFLHAFELPFEGKLRLADVDQEALDLYLSQAQTEAARNLQVFLSAAGGDWAGVAAHVVHGYAPEALVAAARKSGADLIALGAHGRSELAELMLGSVSMHVVLEAPCDVLVAKNQGMQ